MTTTLSVRNMSANTDMAASLPSAAFTTTPPPRLQTPLYPVSDSQAVLKATSHVFQGGELVNSPVIGFQTKGDDSRSAPFNVVWGDQTTAPFNVAWGDNVVWGDSVISAQDASRLGSVPYAAVGDKVDKLEDTADSRRSGEAADVKATVTRPPPSLASRVRPPMRSRLLGQPLPPLSPLPPPLSPLRLPWSLRPPLHVVKSQAEQLMNQVERSRDGEKTMIS